MLLYLKPRASRVPRRPDRIQQAKVLPFHRGLSASERAVIQWLLEHADPKATAFLRQLDVARVTGQCDCGCPTVSMVIPEEVPAAFSRRNLVATAIGLVDGSYLSLMLMQSNGYLTCLNVHNLDPIQKPYSLPTLGELRPYWRL